jgi:hypothetical protein
LPRAFEEGVNAVERSLNLRLLAVGEIGTAPRTSEACCNCAGPTATRLPNAPRWKSCALTAFTPPATRALRRLL